MSDLEKIQKATEIISDELKKAKLYDLSDMKDNLPSLTIHHSVLKIIKGKEVYFDTLFDKLSKNRKTDLGIFYAFKKANRAIEILQKKAIPLMSLSSQSDNDYSEYMEFNNRYFNNAVKYISKNTHSLFYEDCKLQVDNFYIFCFCKNFRNDKFWSDYANNETGVALGFRFDSFSEEKNALLNKYQLRDVFYDDGYAFDFINETRYKIENKLKISFGILPEHNWFPAFYKRARYEWENETRLSFHSSDIANLIKLTGYEGPPYEEFERMSIKAPNGKNGLLLPLNNSLFNLKIVEIICGKNIPQKEFEILNQIALSEDIKIWKKN